MWIISLVKETIMRRFHSYGPVDKDIHFAVPRTDLVTDCLNHIIGVPGKGGHYFTIYAPRQTGKTWLMREVKQRIEQDYPGRFIIGTMSMQGVTMTESDDDSAFFSYIPMLMRRTFKMAISKPDSWMELASYFFKDLSLFSKPVILFIDEFDKLHPLIIDRLANLFRDMYLEQENYLIHGLALIGVKAVLGVDSLKGSPFNIQRTLHVPNLTLDEVRNLFDQYQKESGQLVDTDVLENLYRSTRGQPGLVGWFGELLTEKFNPGQHKPIDSDTWEMVYRRALYTEWNNTVLNLIIKAKGEYRNQVMAMFVKSDIAFTLRAEWCNYLYLNGIIDWAQTDTNGIVRETCRFSSPYIQQCLYDALTSELVGDSLPILALEILDDLSDVFEGNLNLPALLSRYKAYLVRMKAKGLNPFKDQPRRIDLHYTEAVGHFHLYSWLKEAVGGRCVVSQEFPTGNGKVDIHLNCNGKRGIIEVKSFINLSETRRALSQAAAYSAGLRLNSVTLALFVPVEDEAVLAELSVQTRIEDVMVNVVAIGWM